MTHHDAPGPRPTRRAVRRSPGWRERIACIDAVTEIHESGGSRALALLIAVIFGIACAPMLVHRLLGGGYLVLAAAPAAAFVWCSPTIAPASRRGSD